MHINHLIKPQKEKRTVTGRAFPISGMRRLCSGIRAITRVARDATDTLKTMCGPDDERGSCVFLTYSNI